MSIKCKLIRYTLTVFFLCLFIKLEAQITQVNRYEEPADKPKVYDIQPCNEFGLIRWGIYDNRVNSDSLLLVFTAIDTTLNFKWERKFLVDNSRQLIAQTQKGNKAYFLLTSKNIRDRNLNVIEIDVISASTKVHQIKNIIPFSFFDMQIANNAVVIGGYYSYRPFVLLFNFNERIPRVLPGLFDNKSEIVQIKINDNETIDIVLKGKNFAKNTTLFINTYTNSANLINTLELNAEDKLRSLLFGRIKLLEDQSELLAGTYGRKNSEYSRGIFIANVNASGEQAIKYYNFAELQNFFSYMKAKREARIKRRIKRRKVKNKKIRFNYRLMVHQIIEHENQYILLGEAFFPEYKTVSASRGRFLNPVYTVNRGLYSYSRVFEGYRYTHAVVIGFNKKGEILWDNSFEIKDVLSKQLKQFVQVAAEEDIINLLYVFDGAIRSKIIRGSEVIEGKEIVEIKAKFDSDKVDEKGTDVKGLERWYGNYFVAHGYQKIRNLETEGVKLTRQVFFINKLTTKVD